MCDGITRYGIPCDLVASWRVSSTSKPAISDYACGLHLHFFAKFVQVDQDDPVMLERMKR